MLAGEFPGATRDQWAALVDGVLRKSGRIGADAEPGAGVDKLVRRTPEGIPVAPLYTQADVADLPPVGVPGRPPYVRGGTTDGPAPDGWDVRQRHEGPDVREAVLADLENGVTSIWLATGDGVGAGERPGRRAARPRPRRARHRRGRHRSRGRVPRPGGRARRPGRPAGHPRARPDRAAGPHRRGPGRRLDRPARAAGGGRAPAGARDRRRRRSRCTPRAAPTRRSWASRWRRAWRTCGRSPTPGSTSRPRPGSWSSATPPPTSSSPRSRSCAPPVGSGRACWRPPARPTRRASASTPSPRRRCSPAATPT